MKNKKILIATGIFEDKVSGPASYAKLLMKVLPEKGFEIKVQDYCLVLKYPKIIRHAIYFFKLLKDAFGVDLVFALDPVSVGFPAALISKIFGKKFYLKIEGDYAWEQGTQRAQVTDLLEKFSVENEKYPFFVRLLKRIEFWVASSASKIIVPSEYVKKIVSNWGINPQKIKVIYNTLNIPSISESKEDLRSKLTSGTPTIISVGRLVPWKGFEALISVMPSLRQSIPNLKLIIVGTGPDKSFLESKIQALGASDFIEIKNITSQDEFFRYIKAADAFVLNSSQESFPFLLLEVMSLETPVITTSIAGNAEVVQNQKNGVVFQYNNKDEMISSILSVLNSKEKSQALAKEGRATLSEFSEQTASD
ncbi:MAG TPA: glycosyltransferase family 4 protein, partial [Candidatus Paceibacterota bacterium]|nr:glycosyltransferase family 4 protein [Candidatus Paceibacterota bacterium]